MKNFFKILRKIIPFLIIIIISFIWYLLIVLNKQLFELNDNLNEINILQLIETKNINEKLWENKIQYYDNWNIKEILSYKNWQINWINKWYYNNWKIEFIFNYDNWILNWYQLQYGENWNIKEEWNYINWNKNWIRTWYYDNWNIRYIENYKNWQISSKKYLDIYWKSLKENPELIIY